MRRKANNDNNQKEIVAALRKIPGVSVEVGHDDILVGCAKTCECGKKYKATLWREIKNPEYAVSKRTRLLLPSHIEDDQQRILDTFTGDYSIVWSLEQILKEIGINT